MTRKMKTSGKAFQTIAAAVLILLAVITLYPFLNALAISFNDAGDTVRGGITIFPRKFTLENYGRILKDPTVYKAYGITIARTVLGTVLSVLVTGMFAYGLSKKDLVGQRFYAVFVLIPMYVSGGLIPTFLLIKTLGLTNNFLVYILPNVISVWNMMLMRTYFRGIPEAVEESALMEGANHWTIFFRVILPLSAPIVATIALFSAVAQWNSWFDAALYVTNQNLKPIQSVLMNIVNQAKAAEAISKVAGSAAAEYVSQMAHVNERSLSMATMIVTIAPIVMIYPFMQRYFIKGIMAGSLKG